MKKKALRRFIPVVLCMLVLSGCGNQESNQTQQYKQSSTVVSSNASESNTQKIEMNQLPYEVKSEIDNDERYVMLSLTNNSDYTLAGFEIKYKEKSDLTDEQKENFYKELQEDFELEDEDMEDIRDAEISMHAETERPVDPGSTISKINCFYYTGSYYLRNMDHFELMEPDMATVRYIDEGTIYTMYYDYANDSYSFEDETEAADQWTTKDIGNKIPKPDVEYLTAEMDEDDIFMFYAYGFSEDDFNTYVNQCKEMGYTENEDSFDGLYAAENSEGYKVEIYYEQDKTSVTVTAPDESEAEESQTEDASEEEAEDTSDEETEDESSDGEVTPEFKEMMDSYEAFFDEYCEFMEEYNESDDPTSMMADYADFLTQYADYMQKLDDVDEDSLSDADYAYYIDVNARIQKKLLEVSSAE